MRMKKKKQNRLINFICVFIGISILLFIWEISSKTFNNYQIFPDVILTFEKSLQLLSDPKIYLAILTSLGVCLITLIISFILAVIMGILQDLFEPINKILTPLISVLQVSPTAVIVILLLVFVKSSISIITVIFLVVFPILYESIVNGIKNIDKYIILSLELEGIYKCNSIFKVIIPTIMPYIYLGIMQSIGLSMKVEIMAEIVIGSQSIVGMGYYVYQAYAINADFIELFGLVLIILFTFGLVDLLLFKLKNILKKENFL